MRTIVYMFTEQQAPLWFKSAWPENYPIEYFDPDKQYSTGTVFYYDMYGPFQEHINGHLSQGYKVIYDAKNEHYMHHEKSWVLEAFKQYPGQGMFVISGDAPKTIAGVTIAVTQYWYWIVDQRSFLGFNYNKYQNAPSHQYKFFMQLSLQRKERDVLWQQIQPILNQGLCSYKSKGVHLPNDADPVQVPNWQRYMNWDWINSCSVTLIAETNIDDNDITGFSITENDNKFICEKTYKPIAYGHAFLLASTKGNLAHVREQGFETFPELWDESYDHLNHYQDRIAAIVDIIKGFDAGCLNNPIVQQKIAHNRNRFFDTQLAQRLLKETIIDPIIKFANE